MDASECKSAYGGSLVLPMRNRNIGLMFTDRMVGSAVAMGMVFIRLFPNRRGFCDCGDDATDYCCGCCTAREEVS